MNIKVDPKIECNSEFSSCLKYRWSLSRKWDNTKCVCVFIGLNPSTADETVNDPTVNRCMNYAMSWGYGSLIMLNLFAYRSTDPKKLYIIDNPIGHCNLSTIISFCKNADIVIAAWGKHGKHLHADTDTLSVLKNICDVYCLRINKDGTPIHPLYQKKTAKPILYRSML